MTERTAFSREAEMPEDQEPRAMSLCILEAFGIVARSMLCTKPEAQAVARTAGISTLARLDDDCMAYNNV